MKRGDVLSMSAEWTPCLPNRLTRAEMKEYQVGRDAVMAELAELVGFDVVMLG